MAPKKNGQKIPAATQTVEELEAQQEADLEEMEDQHSAALDDDWSSVNDYEVKYL